MRALKQPVPERQEEDFLSLQQKFPVWQTRTKEATVHITELISNVSNAIMEVVGVVSNMVDGINEEKTGASNAEKALRVSRTIRGQFRKMQILFQEAFPSCRMQIRKL